MAETVDAGPTIREERRPITALFADLVGSTTLAEQLDDAEVKLVVAEGIARIVGEIERLGGYVKDLAGDGVLAFFGAPTASEDDAERALLAGFGILESIAAYAADSSRSSPSTTSSSASRRASRQPERLRCGPVRSGSSCAAPAIRAARPHPPRERRRRS
ncbi:MAG TPA: adenylate/guanylate cyclase domain-containing protein, partial [Gaiellaceae bacterium]|nr:adenylate/guanylate cyclase domain-containing protein [Gaiellaceae bacterium]